MTVLDPQTRGQTGRQDESQGTATGRRARPSAPMFPSEKNVGPDERAVSLAAGAIVTAMGLRRGNLKGLLIAGAGGALLYRGLTGRSPTYAALGIDTAHAEDGADMADQIARRGVHAIQAVTINRPVEQLYGFWRDFTNLPRIMSHLESVRVLDGDGRRRSHWVAKAQGMGGAARFEWDAEITREEPNRLIAWRSLPGSEVANQGEVRFEPAPGDRGTEVHVTIDYVPPAGRLGHWIARMLGQNPKRVVREDVRNFKRLMEIGETLTIIGQPHGTCRGQGERYTESEWRPLFT
jgi:uncharacterized membrane protein